MEQTHIKPEAVLYFWFGELNEHGLAKPEVARKWWEKDAEFDAEIRSQFGELHEAASDGDLEGWRSEPHSALALIIVLDQFSRNLYRNSPRMVAQDPAALLVATELIAAGHDRSFPAAWRSFAYMPLEHSEELEDQNRCVALFMTMRDQATEALRDFTNNSLDFAIQHQRIIERFGRFPHRNHFLGRTSTAQEREFLEQPGSSF